ncbi:hypothetical protein B0H13DRAFT_2292386 [Mycena leptocephala]|nr:hypothetical protein B0H13DRAFT_2292386 [Mycena leptocephala]
MPTLKSQLTTDSHVAFPDPEVKKLFHAVREKAFATGDREAVAIMAHALCWWVSLEEYSGPVTPNIVVNQICEEFSFDELKVAVTHMEERQICDPHKRSVTGKARNKRNLISPSQSKLILISLNACSSSGDALTAARPSPTTRNKKMSPMVNFEAVGMGGAVWSGMGDDMRK